LSTLRDLAGGQARTFGGVGASTEGRRAEVAGFSIGCAIAAVTGSVI
jgi:hypothetical protein